MAEDAFQPVNVAVLGGTGKEGSGLVLRWAQAGHTILIGSRDAARAEEKAAEANAVVGGARVRGLTNEQAAAQAEIVVLSVPYSAHRATLDGVKDLVQGKIVVDVTVPLQPPNIRTVYVPPGRAASLEAQALLGEGVRVVAAFQNISAVHLKQLDHEVDSDVLICGDDAAAKQDVARLVEAIPGMRAIDAGPLANAVAVEALTPVLLYINRRYGVAGAGLRLTGLA